MRSEDTSSKAVWFVAGVAIGATIALLYAPHSGADTRRRIRKTAEKGRERLADSSRELFDKGRGLYERGREIADDAAELLERGRRIVEG